MLSLFYLIEKLYSWYYYYTLIVCRQQLAAEVGHAIHEAASDSPDFTPVLSTPSSTSSSNNPTPHVGGASQVSSPPPLSLSHSQVLPTSPSSNVSSFLSPSPFANMFTSSSSSIASPSMSHSLPDVWVALVLEHNKFTAQSLLHYLKLLSFHPDLSFAFDTPNELLKYLAGAR